MRTISAGSGLDRNLCGHLSLESIGYLKMSSACSLRAQRVSAAARGGARAGTGTHLAARTSQLCHDNLHPLRASRSLVTISSPLSAACPLSLSAITVESMVRPHEVA